MATTGLEILRKIATVVFSFGCLAAVSTRSENIDENRGIRTLVIDPGHGGRQPGTVGKRIYEKDINLAVSLRLGALIQEWYPDVRVLYTRTGDETVDIYARGEFANKNKADLFISIHANAVSEKASEEERNATSGSETYILGLHRTEENLKVAMLENSSITDEQNYESNYDGFDPSSPEAYIMFSLMQNVYMEKSLQMAELVQNELQNGPVKRNRGVHQAGFVVLWKTYAPSILIELGFVSNPQEELVMMNPDNQREIAECIFRAFRQYKEITDREAFGL